ncbi:TetR/AcrR family transcriptional regulator [Saccharopolyspora sp. NPDC050389]|uniref:TetR/AcrR family transcriptional regulator n=1 Tax=Saccharopolyspora sp. NPDC050389 TaxID=3155516 RepID=UPI0033D9C70C
MYRRYPDRASIATALLDEHERVLQEKLLRGDPPPGPGAPPAERLAARYEAVVDLLERHIHLVLGTEVGRSRFESGAYGFWRAHVRSLLAESSLAEPESLTDSLLAPLAPEVFQHQHETLGMGTRRIKAGLTELARRIL